VVSNLNPERFSNRIFISFNRPESGLGVLVRSGM